MNAASSVRLPALASYEHPIMPFIYLWSVTLSNASSTLGDGFIFVMLA